MKFKGMPFDVYFFFIVVNFSEKNDNCVTATVSFYKRPVPESLDVPVFLFISFSDAE